MSKTNLLAIHIPPGTIIGGRFRFETLAVGRYSTVFKVEDILGNRQKYCLKIEYDRAPKINYLHQEVAVLNKLATRQYMARLFYCERCDPFSFMLTTLFGQSVWELRQILPNKLLSVGCAARIAVHTLYQIKQIHEVGYILRDLKIGDMLLGLHGKEAKMVFLVDFGMCRSYIRKDTNGTITLRPPKKQLFVRGILRYCSPRVHKRQDVCRADDLWSLAYILVDLTTGLPWRNVKPEKTVANMKETITDEVLFQKCPAEWIKMIKHIRSLRYKSRPDYKLIYDCLHETLVRLHVSYSDPWDWDVMGDDVIVEQNSSDREDSSKSKSERDCNELKIGLDEEDVPKLEKNVEMCQEPKSPFSEIINALRKSPVRAIIVPSSSPAPGLSPQKRVPAAEYDPTFPTTNPEEFAKNDIGI